MPPYVITKHQVAVNLLGYMQVPIRIHKTYAFKVFDSVTTNALEKTSSIIILAIEYLVTLKSKGFNSSMHTQEQV